MTLSDVHSQRSLPLSLEILSSWFYAIDILLNRQSHNIFTFLGVYLHTFEFYQILCSAFLLRGHREVSGQS